MHCLRIGIRGIKYQDVHMLKLESTLYLVLRRLSERRRMSETHDMAIDGSKMRL